MNDSLPLAKHSLVRAFNEPVFWAFWRVPEGERDMDAVRAAVRRFEAMLQIAAGRIAPGGYIAGDGPGLADLWVGHTLYRYFTLDLVRDPPAGIEAYYDRLVRRPGYAAHVMVDYGELKGVWGRGHWGG